MIEMEQVSKTYKGARAPALAEVSLAIPAGAFGLLGPNGAGKTTLMRILATLVAPSAGRALVAGHDVRTGRAAIRGLLGFLPQDFGFYPRLTAYENLDHLTLLSGLGRGRRACIEEALQAVNLQDVARARVGTLSGGMRQRLGIAQALLNHPAVLIVDEPTVGLDPSERMHFRTLLAGLAARTTVLLSTHIVADIASTCTDVAVLRQGRIVYRGATVGLTARAGGMVWGATVTPAQFPAIERACTVAEATATPAGLELRLVGTPPPGLAVVPLEPTLEDGYLAVVEGGAGVPHPQPGGGNAAAEREPRTFAAVGR